MKNKELYDTIGVLIALHPDRVIKALRDNDLSIYNGNLAKAVVQGFDNKNFVNDLKALANSYSNFTGLEYGNLSSKADLGLNPTSVNIQPDTTSSGSGFFSGINVGTLLGTGANIFTGIKQNEAQEKLAESQIKAKQLELQTAIEQGKISRELAQLELAKLQNQPKQPNNTLLYVGLGVTALLMFGGLIYVANKK